jgi:hypothetical protein
MCLGVFVASGQALDPVPWDARAPAFHVAPLSEQELAVRSQFSLPHVGYAGAHTGCSCGFLDDPEHPSAVSRSRAALVEYIRRLSAAGPVELFVCWDGDYERTARQRAERSTASLATDDEWLQELTFTRIAKHAA